MRLFSEVSLMHNAQVRIQLVGDGVLDVPRAANIDTANMTLRGTFSSATEINAKFIISS